jgi:hypothetical protein
VGVARVEHGGGLEVVRGRYDSRKRTSSSTALSSGAVNAAMPDFTWCAWAPPRSCWLTSSPVTVFTTSGPVMNMYDVSSTMKMKSVSAGL